VDAISSESRITTLVEHGYGPDDVTLWLKLFAAIDAAEETLPQSKDFRVAILCEGGNAPGDAPEGPCGPPPSEVKDPAARAQYEAAIAKNEGARLAGNNYAEIMNLKDQVDSYFWTWTGGIYRGNADAQTKIGQEAKALGCSQALVGWIQSVTAEPPGAFPPVDQAARDEFIANVPVALKTSRSGKTLTVSLDATRKRALLPTAGRGRVRGIKSELRFYPEGTQRPAQSNGALSLSSSVESIWAQNQETTIPARPGTTYVVEEDLTIFETDVPTQHMWAPQDSTSYKVLWSGVLKQTVK